MERTNAWSKYTSEKDLKKVMAFGEDYRKFLSQCKTERECIDFFVEKAEAAGYINLENAIAKNTKLKAGDKVYAVNKGKMMAVFNIGTESLENGLNILGAHIDSPRMDLKQTDFSDIWWVGDRADGGFVAIQLKNALSTDGFSLQTSKNGKGQIALNIIGHVSINAQKEVPMVFYSADPENTGA